MKRIAAMLFFGLVLSVPSFAWNCSVPGQIRVQVPSGTTGNGTGDGSGQVVVDSGLTFICEALPPTTPPTTPSTSTSSSNSTSGATSSSTSGATSNSGASATGGNSSSTSQGGSVGVVKSTSGVSNSGNSNVGPISTTATGGQGGTATQRQSNSSSNNNASSASGGNNSNDSTEVTNIRPASANAFAPVGFATAPCLATFGAGAQTIPGGVSFGGSRTDKGCDSRATAQQFALLLGNRLAAAKILCTTKAAKRARLTMDDCLAYVPTPAPVVSTVVPIVSAPVTPSPVPVVVTVNVPQPLVYLTPVMHEEITVTPKLGDFKPAKKVLKRTGKPCIVPPALQKPMEK